MITCVPSCLVSLMESLDSTLDVKRNVSGYPADAKRSEPSASGAYTAGKTAQALYREATVLSKTCMIAKTV